MAKFKIKQDRVNCIGCGACAANCPVNWIMKLDGKSTPKKKEIDVLGCNKLAAANCPVNVIHIFNAKGKKVAG